MCFIGSPGFASVVYMRVRCGDITHEGDSIKSVLAMSAAYISTFDVQVLRLEMKACIA